MRLLTYNIHDIFFITEGVLTLINIGNNPDSELQKQKTINYLIGEIIKYATNLEPLDISMDKMVDMLTGILGLSSITIHLMIPLIIGYTAGPSKIMELRLLAHISENQKDPIVSRL